METEFKDDWESVLEYWHGSNAACFYERCEAFTKKYPDNAPGWIALANSLWSYAKYSEAYQALLNAKKLIDQDGLIAILNDLGKAVVRASCSRGRDARTTVPISNGIAIVMFIINLAISILQKATIKELRNGIVKQLKKEKILGI